MFSLVNSIAELSGMIQGKLQIQTAAVADLVSSKRNFLVYYLSGESVFKIFEHSLMSIYTPSLMFTSIFSRLCGSVNADKFYITSCTIILGRIFFFI